jgi:hypothetical protein
MPDPFTDLDEVCGHGNGAVLAAAYEAVLAALTRGHLDPMPGRAVRLALVEAMVGEGRSAGYDAPRLTAIGLRASGACEG